MSGGTGDPAGDFCDKKTRAGRPCHIMDFPYGKAPLVILIAALLSGAALWLAGSTSATARGERKPDLVFATFEKNHAEAYRQALPEFERRYSVKIQIQVVDPRALQKGLQSALLVGADVPDVCELLDGTMVTVT